MRYWGDYRIYAQYVASEDGSTWFGEQQLNTRLRFPLWGGLLGSLDVGAGVYWDALRVRGEGASRAGLGGYDLALSLFPYRAFPVTVYLQRFMRGPLGSAAGFQTTTGGVRWSFRTHSAGQWLVDVQENKFTQGPFSIGRRLYRLDQNRVAGETTAVLHAEFQEMSPGGGSDPLRLGWANYDTFSRLRDGSTLQTTTYLQETQSGGGTWTGLTTSGIFNRPLSEGASLTVRGQAGAGWARGEEIRSFGISTWLDRSREDWRLFGGGSADFAWRTGGVEGATLGRGGAFVGASKRLGGGWRIFGDAALRNAFGNHLAIGTGEEAVFHVGAAYGSGLQPWISNLAFAFKDISFERRLYEAFPPGYRSPEILELRRRYYEGARGGSQGFGIEATHLTGAGRTADAAHLSCNLQFNHTLDLQLFGEWFRESTSEGWEDLEKRDVTLRASWMARSGVSLSGYATAGRLKRSPLKWGEVSWFRQGAYNSMGVNLAVGLLRKGELRVTAQRFGSQQAGRDDQLWVEWDWAFRDLHVQLVGRYVRILDAAALSLPPPQMERRTVQINLVRVFRGNAY